MLLQLPTEITVSLLANAPSSALRLTSSHFYILYNHLFYKKIVATFGEQVLELLIRIKPWLKTYIKTLDAFRFHSRNIVASRLGLLEEDDPENPLNCAFIRDSWRYIYAVLRNKRLFAEYNDYQIDEPTNYVYNHFVEVNRTYLLSLTKFLYLCPGTYNLNIGLVVKHGSGLGTTKFEIKYHDADLNVVTQTFYPPTNINDIIPKKQFCLLRLGEFTLPNTKRLFKVQLVMEEIGLYLKSGFRIYFIDLAPPTVLFNEFDLLYYSVRETDYRYFINIPLKNLYKALNYAQNGPNADLDDSTYGSGDPYDIIDSYDNSYVKDSLHNQTFGRKDSLIGLQDPNLITTKQLMRYADFYYNRVFIRRYFKFNTIYQKRQFVNRYGDFEIDWAKGEENYNTTETTDSYSTGGHRRIVSVDQNRACNYDTYGLKWKIPTMSELDDI